AINDWITRTDAKRARPHSHTLHRLFNCFGNRTHACAPRGYGRHAAEILQAFRKAACVPIDVAVKLRKGHDIRHATILSILIILLVHQFEITPEAFANFSPGLEQSDNPGITTSISH